MITWRYRNADEGGKATRVLTAATKRFCSRLWLRLLERQASPVKLDASKELLIEAMREGILAGDPTQMNVLLLSGTLSEGPNEIVGRRPRVSLVTLAHSSSTVAREAQVVNTHLEVPRRLLANHPGKLELGEPVVVVGEAIGAGGILVTSLWPATNEPGGGQL